jgi:hypothetical protein
MKSRGGGDDAHRGTEAEGNAEPHAAVLWYRVMR